jgi:tetratricopeptide (TPR) repeat protein
MVALWLAGCSSTKTATPARIELSRMAATARVAYEQGSVSQAARLYVRTLKMARVQDDPVEIGNSAYNLAACLIALDKYDDARNLLQEAKHEFDRAKRPIPSILLLDAKAARLQGKSEEALALADQVLVSMNAGKGSRVPLQVLLFKTQVACDRGDVATAKLELVKAQKMLKIHDEPILKADAAGVAGRLALLEGDPVRAAQEYDLQVDYFKRAEKYRDMALSLGLAGQAYRDANIFLPAVDRFYRSARSLYAQGDELSALKMVEAALASGKNINDRNLLLRTQALFEEIKKQVEDSKPVVEEKTP